MAEENKKPQGWHLKPEFIDANGDVYHRGKLQPKGTNTEKPIDLFEQSEVKPKAEVKSGKSESSEIEELKAKLAESDKRLADNDKKFADLVSEVKKITTASTSVGFDVNKFADAIAEANQRQAGHHVYKTVENIDADDYDEKGVEFFSRDMGFLITCDKRGEHSIKPPLGAIIHFKQMHGKIIRGRRGDNRYDAKSSYISHSKATTKFLRESTFYNKIIFEKSDKIVDSSAIMYMAASSVGKRLDAMHSSDLLRLAKEHGFSIADSLDVIKQHLLVKFTKEEVAKLEAIEKQKEALEKEKEIFN